MKKHFLLIKVCFVLTILNIYHTAGQTLVKFSLNGHTAYHVSSGKINDIPVVFTASYDGKVICHTQTGTHLWTADAGNGFPFDLESADIDGDGSDEALVATSDGAVYAFDDSGSLLWTFKREAPLYQVEVLKNGENITILTGGIERKLYSLDKNNGSVIAQLSVTGVVRLIGFGKILGDGNYQVAVTTTRHSLSGNVKMYILNPSNFTIHSQSDIKYDAKKSQNGRFFSMAVFDINNDGKEELILGHDHTQPDFFTIVFSDGTFETRAVTGPKITTNAYKMNIIHHIKSTTLGDEYLLNHYGHKIILMNLDGSIRSQHDAKYAFTNSCFDPNTNTVFFSSEVSGGDGIYAFKITESNWKTQFSSVSAVGKMITIENNLNALQSQINNFTPPPYQPEVKDFDLWVTDFRYHNASFGSIPNVNVGRHETDWSENYDRSYLLEGWASKKDSRQDYAFTQAQLVSKATQFENTGKPFGVWGGHGSDPFYLQLETMRQIMVAAPNTLMGFDFAELEQTNNAMKYAIDTHIKGLAEHCLTYDKKIYIRAKNIFWTGGMYHNTWQSVLGDPKYKSVIIPGLEETNCRTQSLSLYARMGLRTVGRIGDFGARPVTDNANFVRTFEWCQLQHMSHQLRAGAIARVLGANTFVQSTHTGMELELKPLYEMIGKGILPMVDPENIISIPDVAIGMKLPLNTEYLDAGENGHSITGYSANEPTKVFDRLDCYWGGALVPDYDFTNYAFNQKRRMTDFIAQAPYGNIAVIPASTDITEFPRFTKLLLTDGKFWYDQNGNQKSAQEYKSTVLNELELAAEKLPIRVIGEVSWSAVKLDDVHYRIFLIDPGYTDPDDREVEIHFNGIKCNSATDILRKETLTLNNNKISLTVPMGILRIVDIEASVLTISAGSDKKFLFEPDSVVFNAIIGDPSRILSYNWSQISGYECTLIQPDSASLIVKDLVEGQYTFRLTVLDNESNTFTDEVNLTIICELCRTPVITLSEDRLVQLPQDTILLHASATVARGAISGYNWQKISGSELIMTDNNTSNLTLSNLSAGQYILSCTVSSDSGFASTATITVQVLPAPFTVNKTQTPFIIDGIKDFEWCNEVFELDKLVKGFVNNSASASFAWDDDKFYALINVNDNYLIHDSGLEWWNDDATEIFIDTDNSKDSELDGSDFRYGFRWHWNASSMDIFETYHGSTAGVEWIIREVSGGYWLEVAIPWITLNHFPQLNDKIGIEVRVLNDDDGSVNDAIKAMFGNSGSNIPKPMELGTIILGNACFPVSNNNMKIIQNPKVYPTISSDGRIFIESNDWKINNCFLKDVSGRVVLQKELNTKDELDISHLPPGIYFLNFNYNTYGKSVKIIKL
jgi:lambda-carrageenase